MKGINGMRDWIFEIFRLFPLICNNSCGGGTGYGGEMSADWAVLGANLRGFGGLGSGFGGRVWRLDLGNRVGGWQQSGDG